MLEFISRRENSFAPIRLFSRVRLSQSLHRNATESRGSWRCTSPDRRESLKAGVISGLSIALPAPLVTLDSFFQQPGQLRFPLFSCSIKRFAS
jgi:hypothetical protein